MLLRRCLKVGAGISFCALTFDIKEAVKTFVPDTVSKDTATEREADFSIVKEETGWDRLKRMFTRDEFGSLSSELEMILQVACMSTFVGGVYGGFTGSKHAYMDFIKNNKATAFKDHFEAKRKLQDAITLNFGRNAFRWGWRLCFFTTTFVTLATVINVYRGKAGFIEYVVGGALSGAIYKFEMGPQGMMVGGVVGGVLGAFAGATTLTLLKMSGMSMEEARYWQTLWSHERSERFRKALQKHVEEENFEVIRLHDMKLGAEGEDIANVDKEGVDKNVDSSVKS